MTTRTLRAHAKLTLSLHVTGVRADGYHLIDAEMVSLELHDLLTFSSGAGADAGSTRLRATGPFADGVPLDHTNLVARALELADVSAGVTIDKRIPHGGGLGGGSTDAAAALRWAGYGTGIADLERAAGIGADVAFCMVGGPARVRGIGEIVEPVTASTGSMPGRPITLIIPPLRVSTPAVYRAWDQIGATQRSGERNDLEAAALVVEPALERWRDEITERIGVRPMLAGSGATWFLDHEPDATGAAATDGFRELESLGATIVHTHTVDAGRATGPGA